MAIRLFILFVILAVLGVVGGGYSPMNAGALVLACIVYCAPSVIAEIRKHKGRGSISVMNLFFGWTLIGWVVALAWAFGGNTENRKVKA